MNSTLEETYLDLLVGLVQRVGQVVDDLLVGENRSLHADPAGDSGVSNSFSRRWEGR